MAAWGRTEGWDWPQIAAEVETLDPDHLCAAYWHGKRQRQAAVAGLLPWRSRAASDPAAVPAEGGCSGRKRRRCGAALEVYSAVTLRIVSGAFCSAGYPLWMRQAQWCECFFAVSRMLPDS